MRNNNLFPEKACTNDQLFHKKITKNYHDSPVDTTGIVSVLPVGPCFAGWVCNEIKIK